DMFKNMGIEIDTAPRAVNSLRYLAYDSNAYVNPKATKFRTLLDATKPVITTPTYHQDHPTTNYNGDDLAWFRRNCTVSDMHEILTNSRFTYHSSKGSHHYYTRPDKHVQAGLSVDYDDERKTLFSFSSNVPMLG